MEARFFADYAVEGGRPISLSKELRNPVILITTRDGGAGVPPRDHPLRPGESFRFGGGTVTFQELRYAVKFFVRRERGVGLVYGGFVLACAALVARLFFYRREYALQETQEPGGARIEVGGRSEFYQALFEEEFDRMVAKLVAGGVGTLAPPDGGDGR
jgi:cytochrome c biogenesis protein ResB